MMKEPLPRNSQLLRRALVLLGLVVGAAAIAAVSGWRWLKSANAVDILELTQKAGGSPVRFDGDVTYYDVTNATAVAEDGSSAIAVTVPANVPLRVGQRIRVSGTLPKDYDPTAPIPLTLEDAVFTTLEQRAALPLRR